jgi:hypothetical protein
VRSLLSISLSALSALCLSFEAEWVRSILLLWFWVLPWSRLSLPLV